MPRVSRVLPVLVVLLVGACHIAERRPAGPDNNLAQVLVAPDSVTLDPLAAWQFGVFGRTTTGDSIPVSVDWSASAGVIDANALYTADSSEDDVTITAQVRSNVSGAIPLLGRAVVHKRRVVQLILKPEAVSLLPGASQQFTTLGVRNRGDTTAVQVNYAATGGTITASGLFTAGSTPGSYTVIATRGALADTATITIFNPPVASVSVSPSSKSLYVGSSSQLTATTKDAAGNVLNGRTITWSSSVPAVATVSSSGMVRAMSAGSATITATSEGQSGSSSIGVAIVPVASVTVTPATSLLRIGTGVQLTATTKDSAGSILTGRIVTWASDAPGIASVSSSGSVTAVAVGSATLTASSEGKSGTATITVTVVPVATIAIAPPTAVLRVATTVRLTATTKDSAGTVLPGRAVSWSTSAPTVATVSSSGVVSAVAAGSATITATSEGKSATSSITVTLVPVASVSVAPASVSVFIGGSTQLSATTKDSAGNILPGRVVTWGSSAPSIATVSASGVVSGVSAGAVTISAISEGQSGSASITVIVVPVASVIVAPATKTLRIGTAAQLTATTQDSVGNALSGRTVTWSSSAPAVATVSGAGLVTAATPGSATITATSEGKTGTSAITVTVVPVAAVTVSPASVSLVIGGTTQLAATTADSAGNALSGRVVTWTTSAPSVATVSASGLVTAVAAGSVTLSATSEGKSGSATVTVNVVAVATVTIAPASASVTVGATTQLTATTKDAAGNVLTGRTVTWSSSAPGVATVSSSGLVTAVAAGSATITATSEGQSGTSAITIAPVPVASVSVAPATKLLRVGTSGPLTATTKDASGNVLTGRVVTWSSNATSVATVSTAGLVTAVGVGSATITATSEGQSGTATITVTLVPVSSVTVSPASGGVNIGATLQLSATTKDSAGNVLTGRVVTWSSSALAIATVSGSGLVNGVIVGSATITASSEGKSGTAAVTVIDPTQTRAGYYVATSGSSSGTGSVNSPWDLRTALAGASGRIQPGDTVWVRGGTYSGAFTSSVAGSPGQPVVIRAYPGERAIIDGAPSTQETFTINGNWSTFWGLEIMNSLLTRNARRPQGIYVYLGSHVKIINFIVHDVGEGLYTESSADDVEIYGSIFYNQGWQTTIRSDGHGVYVKNTGPIGKFVRDNVFFNSYGLGIHGYTDAGGGFLRNIVIEGNVMFNAGTISTYPSANLLLGGEEIVENGVVKDNMLYFSPGKGSTNARLGYLSVANSSVSATGNYIIGGATPLDLGFWNAATVSGNTIMGSGHILSFRDDNAGGYSWSGQRYYRDPNASAWSFNGSWSSLSSWENATGLGATDFATTQLPTLPAVFVRPNVYEAGRATVVVYNWSGQGSITVDLSSVLSTGAHYEVRSVQNLFGAPITSGTFGGSITIPLAAVPPIQPIGGSDVAPAITGPAFDVFEVIVVP